MYPCCRRRKRLNRRPEKLAASMAAHCKGRWSAISLFVCGEDKVTEVLETERLLLRAPEAADLRPLVRLISNLAVAKNLATVPHPYTEHDGSTWLAEMAVKRGLREDYPFSILRKADGMYLGCCAVHPARGFEFGYWLGEPFWGKG